MSKKITAFRAWLNLMWSEHQIERSNLRLKSLSREDYWKMYKSWLVQKYKKNHDKSH